MVSEICDLDCGKRGHCESGVCVCDDGWLGDNCDVQKCDQRCSAHGMCSNGTCLCTNGWNGKHCTLEGCPGNCNGHGTCTMPTYQMAWECLCETGWYGSGCDIELEQSCDDKKDNDNGESLPSRYFFIRDMNILLLSSMKLIFLLCLQMVWLIVRILSAVRVRYVNAPNCATLFLLPSTFSLESNLQQSRHLSMKECVSS